MDHLGEELVIPPGATDVTPQAMGKATPAAAGKPPVDYFKGA